MQVDNNVFHRSPAKSYPTIVRGEGVYLYDDAGRRYLDACSGSLVTNIGHGVSQIAEVIAEQARTLAFVHGSRWTSQPMAEAAERIASMTPPGLDRIYFVNSGSEATEAAVKMARQFYIERDGPDTPKAKIVGRWLGFHGVTLGALGYGGNLMRRQPFLPMLHDQPHAEPCYCYRCPYGLEYPECGVTCASDVERLIQQEGPETIAAFIAEPVVGAAIGAVPAVPEYFKIIRSLCDTYDILLIIDEVMTGFGRTGANFAIDHYGVVPDIMAMAKGMGAGYSAIAGVATTERVWSAFRQGSGQFVHGHTYGGNPLATATSAAVLTYLQRHSLIERVKQLEPLFFAGLESLRRHPIVGDIRGKGLMAALEFVQDRETRDPFERSLRVADRVSDAAFERGVIVYPGSGNAVGCLGDHILLGPPFVITEEQIDEMIKGLDGALSEVSVQLVGVAI